MLSEKPWRPDAVVRLLLMVFVGLSVGTLLGMGLGALFPHLAPEEKKFFGFVIGALSFQGAGLIWIDLFLREHGVAWGQAFGFSKPNTRRAVLLGLLALTLVLPVTLALGQFSSELLNWFRLNPQPQAAVRILQQGLPLPQVIAYGFAAIILAPFAEELLFRGVLYPLLKQNGYPRAAWWTTSLLFAATHLNLMAFIPLTVLALVLTALYEVTDNLLAPITAHSAFNGVNFMLLILPQYLRSG